MTNAGSANGDNEDVSSFKLLQTLLDDWWKASNSAEHHIRPIRRKVVHMLSKAIWSMEIVRIIFQLMGENLSTIDQQQGDRMTSPCVHIDPRFQCSLQSSIGDYLRRECEQTEHSKYIMWSTTNDVLVGYHWYSRKMLVVETLLTLNALPDVITQRIGSDSHEK